jgi:GntR family transcriptional regulator
MSEPRYKTIADDLRRRIAKREWTIGDKIPSIAELMDQYNVPSNLQLIRHAQSVLIDEGLLRAEQGRGVFVIAYPNQQETDRIEALEEVRDAIRRLRRAEALLESATA